MFYAIIGIGIVLRSASDSSTHAKVCETGFPYRVFPKQRSIEYVKHADHKCTLNKTLKGRISVLGGLKDFHSAVNTPWYDVLST